MQLGIRRAKRHLESSGRNEVVVADDPQDTEDRPGALLSAALRGIRKARGLRSSDVASAMGLPIRSYQRFEAGQGEFDLDLIQRFADATDSDPFAIAFSVWIKRPHFALDAMDNKPMVTFVLTLRAFQEEMGEDISLIESRVWWGGFRRVFGDLEEYVRRRDLSAETWLEEHAQKLGLNVSFLTGRRKRSQRG